MTAASTLPLPQSIDDLRTALLKTHGTSVSQDDPVLMVYTIHRASLEETVQALDTFRTLLNDDVATISAAHTDEVRAALRDITEAVMSDALKQRLAAMQESAVLADRAVGAMQRAVRWGAFLTFLNILAALMALTVLSFMLA